MKILILGGTGSMGANCASLLHNYSDVKLTLGVRSMEKAEQIMHEMKMDPFKVKPMVIDIMDKESVINAMKAHDVVLNAIGPFVKYGRHILLSAIEAKVNYVDICDDYDATLDLLSLDEQAKEAGISALICMGTTPGITNIQAKYAVSFLDEIDSLKICWAVSTPPFDQVEGTGTFDTEAYKANPKDVIPKGAWEHLVHVGKGEVPVLKNGKMTTEPALEKCEYVDFAKPLGRAQAFVIGHSESITLPRAFQINDYCACFGALMPKVMKQLRKECCGRKAPLFVTPPPDGPLWQAPDCWRTSCVWGGQVAIAEGKRNGKRVRCTIRFMLTTKYNEAVVYNNAGQTIGCYFMGSGRIKQKGVLAPEDCIDTKAFFEELAHQMIVMNDRQYTADDLILVELSEI